MSRFIKVTELVLGPILVNIDKIKHVEEGPRYFDAGNEKHCAVLVCDYRPTSWNLYDDGIEEDDISEDHYEVWESMEEIAALIAAKD